MPCHLSAHSSGSFHRRISGSYIHKFGWIVKISPAEMSFVEIQMPTCSSWIHFHFHHALGIILHAGKSFHRCCAHSVLGKIYQASYNTIEDDPPAKSKINPRDQPSVLVKDKGLDPTCTSSLSLEETIQLAFPPCLSADEQLCRTAHRRDHTAPPTAF